MYYQEKKTIVSIISGILILVAYSIYGFSKYQAVGVELLNDLKFWATAMLIFISVGIGISILIQIVFHIILAIANEVVKEASKEVTDKVKCKGFGETCEEFEIPDVEDEMDKLIALKAMRNSLMLVGLGFVIALLSLYMKMPPAIMLNIIYISFSLGLIFEGFSRLYFYRKGVRND